MRKIANALWIIPGVVLLLTGCARTPAVPTPELHFAALNGEDGKVDLLIAQGADVNKKGNRGTTALHLAAFKGHSDTVTRLLDHGADISAEETKTHDTALHRAAQWGHLKVVKLLVDRGADVNAQNRRDETPLFLAARSGHDEVVNYLLQQEGRIIPPHRSKKNWNLNE